MTRRGCGARTDGAHHVLVVRRRQVVLGGDQRPWPPVDLDRVAHEDVPLEERAVRLQREVGEKQPIEVVGLQDLAQVGRAQLVGRVHQRRPVALRAATVRTPQFAPELAFAKGRRRRWHQEEVVVVTLARLEDRERRRRPLGWLPVVSQWRQIKLAAGLDVAGVVSRLSEHHLHTRAVQVVRERHPGVARLAGVAERGGDRREEQQRRHARRRENAVVHQRAATAETPTEDSIHLVAAATERYAVGLLASMPSPRWGSAGLAAALLFIGLRRAWRRPLPSLPLHDATTLRRCAALFTEGDLWVAVYGDSLARALFFDVASLVNRSTLDDVPPAVHPGHSANYSTGCLLFQRRPPTLRSKCAAFELVAPLAAAPRPGRLSPVDPIAPGRERRPRPGRPRRRWRRAHGRSRLGPARAASEGGDDDASFAGVGPALGGNGGNDGGGGGGGGRRRRRLRLSFRLKTFAWEAAYDGPWLAELRSAARRPDVLVLGFGIWDMQYPPRDDLAHSPAAFNASLRRFVRRLGDALGSRAAPSRILWLTVTAVATPSLPSWKRARMSAARSRAFNDLAAPVLRAHGIEVVDTFASGLRHPELSPDGVHFPGTLSQYHAHLLLEQLCSG